MELPDTRKPAHRVFTGLYLYKSASSLNNFRVDHLCAKEHLNCMVQYLDTTNADNAVYAELCAEVVAFGNQAATRAGKASGWIETKGAKDGEVCTQCRLWCGVCSADISADALDKEQWKVALVEHLERHSKTAEPQQSALPFKAAPTSPMVVDEERGAGSHDDPANHAPVEPSDGSGDEALEAPDHGPTDDEMHELTDDDMDELTKHTFDDDGNLLLDAPLIPRDRTEICSSTNNAGGGSEDTMEDVTDCGAGSTGNNTAGKKRSKAGVAQDGKISPGRAQYK